MVSTSLQQLCRTSNYSSNLTNELPKLGWSRRLPNSCPSWWYNWSKHMQTYQHQRCARWTNHNLLLMVRDPYRIVRLEQRSQRSIKSVHQLWLDTSSINRSSHVHRSMGSTSYRSANSNICQLRIKACRRKRWQKVRTQRHDFLQRRGRDQKDSSRSNTMLDGSLHQYEMYDVDSQDHISWCTRIDQRLWTGFERNDDKDGTTTVCWDGSWSFSSNLG